MLIFAEQISERLIYTLDFVFRDRGITYRITNDENEFLAVSELRLNYSDFPFEADNFLTIIPSGLLFAEKWHPVNSIRKTAWEQVECLEINKITDPLSAIFYVLTRYEEYHFENQDKHGRFPARSSVCYPFGWLERQIVEEWVTAIFSFLNPNWLKTWDRTIQFIPTFDIDNTFAFKWKEGWRSWLSNSKDQLKGNTTRKELRKAVQNGEMEDPFDSFEAIRDIAQACPETRVFWLLADFSKFDKNLSWSDARHQELIRSINQVARVGIHPGYRSNEVKTALAEEIKRLALIQDRPVKESRQHFLKLTFPETYERLITQGIEQDFTMGYADEVGFRAGTARSHAFFNIETNTYHRNFRITPFCYMDGTLLEYKRFSIEEANIIVGKLFEEVVKYGGNFCFIWHNETLAEAGKWKGWRAVVDYSLACYESYLKRNSVI